MIPFPAWRHTNLAPIPVPPIATTIARWEREIDELSARPTLTDYERGRLVGLLTLRNAQGARGA